MASGKIDKKSASSSIQPKYPEPITFLPKLEHRQSIIILHGRGSTAERFGSKGCVDKTGVFRDPILSTSTSCNETLQTAFPRAKVIFPTAARTHATIYGKSIHQWFDTWHLEDRKKDERMMVDGLRQSVEFVHGLLREEIEAVGRENVVLWGLSQGCATSLVSLLIWEGAPFAATVGMCGWLPFDGLVGIGEPLARARAEGVVEKMQRATLEDKTCRHCEMEFTSKTKLSKHIKICDMIPECMHCGDKFSSEELLAEHLVECKSYDSSLPPRGVMLLRRKLGVGERGLSFRNVPVFLGHGTEDKKVDMEFGREAKRALDSVGCDVQMKEYEDLGHWTSPEMMADIFNFLKEKLGRDLGTS